MPSYNVKFRVTHPVEMTTVDAPTREEAILQVIAAADEGDEVDVWNADEMAAPADPPAGDATKTSGRGRSKPNPNL